MHPRRIPAAMTAERDVIVVGAGFAGLACAQRLASANVDFLVLEASDRIGGRALTTTTVAPGFPLELGALMIHGKRVVTHAWLRELGLHAVRLPTMQTARFVRDGRVARFARLALPFHPTFGTRAFWQAVRGVPRDIRRYGGPDMSLAEFLENEDVLPGAREIVTLLRAHAAAAEPDEVGILGHAEEDRAAQEEFGYSNFRLVEGYSALVGRRAGPCADRILRSRIVTGIRWSDAGVRLTARVNGSPEEHRAKRAILTVPLGALKAGAIAFEPPLPEAKRRAIEAIGFGAAMVIQMRFASLDPMRRLGDFGILSGGGASTFHRAYVRARGAPPVLAAFVVGREARRRADMTDAEALRATLEELESIVPEARRLGAVVAAEIARWPADPFVRGGYSFLRVHARLAHRTALAAPVDGVLFFAGEATHDRGEAQTVHGAIETGYRAANEAIASLAPA